tara:strand:- start:589 stop:948 length:360 start_codon:yes stop_codon:yes gene_type:complete
MLSEKNSINYFLFGCIPARILIAVIPLIASAKILFYYSFILLAIAIGFLYLYFTNGRMNAPEAGGKTWWANYRIIHGLLYLIAAWYAFNKQQIAYAPLSLDVCIGLGLFLNKHYLHFTD